MAWEYLLTDRLDARVVLVAGYLANRIDGKVIVDLNCGHAPILKYLPQTYKAFYGNDILAERLPEYPRAEFSALTDEEFAKRDLNTDILLVLGMGGYEQSHEELESKTLNKSIIDIVRKDMPEIVVMELVQKFIPTLDMVESDVVKLGYRPVHKVKIETEDTWVQKRFVAIYETNHRNTNE